jgi:molybdopterin converting factor small subunit
MVKHGLTSEETKQKTGSKVTIEIMSWIKEDFEYQGWDRLAFTETVAPGTTIIDLLHILAEKYPKFGQKAFGDVHPSLLDYCAVILNCTFLSSEKQLDYELKEGDNIKLSPGFYGG